MSSTDRTTGSSIFSNIKNTHSTAVLHKVRRLEKAILSQVRYKSHLRFCHLSKEQGKLPRFLRFRPPLKSVKAKALAQRTGWAYLRLIISQSHERLRKSVEKMNELKSEVRTVISDHCFEDLMKEVSREAEQLKSKLLDRQNKKLDFCADDSHDHEEIKKKWVVNASSADLKDSEVQLLRKGLNFAMTPSSIPRKDIVASVEQSISGLPAAAQDEIRVEVSHILKNAKPPKTSNITREEREALRGLQQNENILILPADKGNAVVVMNKSDYQQEIKSRLQDRKTYEQITDKRRNPTAKTARDLQRKLQSLKQPINSCIGSPTYEVSKYLARVLKTLQKGNHYTVRNSTEFSEFVINQRVADDEELVSFDVVSLFTSIPVKLAIEVVKTNLEQSDEWKETTNLTVEQVIGLLEIVLNNSYFTYAEMHYHQVFGCAMGSPVSAVIADLVMNNIEDRTLSTSPVTPSWWRRYVDDSNVCLKKTDVQVLHQHLNSIDSNIQFTIERAKQTDKGRRISFLDTQITVLSNGSIEIEVFRKVTHTNKYLDFASHNPM
ncbi:hypothetical protein ACROYT_G035593 [Oculina patagonica]